MKWSGSKESQAAEIIKLFPKQIETYYEPFLGGGSIFLNLLNSDIKINKYILSDLNSELISVYNLIKNDHKLLIDRYIYHYNNYNSGDIQHRKDYFKKVKEEFNISKKAEDFYFIMRTTTNGMPRYNRKGEFNNSCHFSRSGMNPLEVKDLIEKYHILFNSKDITFISQDYKDIIPTINDFCYLDSPYENTNSMYFGGFNNMDFINWVNGLDVKYCLSYDGKVNDDEIEHMKPNYNRHIYLRSGNSSFRRVIGKSNDSIVYESIYLNY